jgi:sialidase-1
MKIKLLVLIFAIIAVSCKDNLNKWAALEASFEVQKIYDSERFPNIVAAKDGSIVTTWGNTKIVARRSEDGGKSWDKTITIANPGFQGGGTIVDDNTGKIFAFVEEKHPVAPIHLYSSEDNGKSWEKEPWNISPDKNGHYPAMHMNEHGITLKYGKHAGRLIRPSRYYGKTNDRSEWPNHYTNAIYSDDNGKTWKTSDPFPANGTGEAALVELSDGTIYYNSRRHLSTDGLNPKMRHIAWSEDGGVSWENLSVSKELPDGSQHRDYGLMGGLTRLPVDNHDILLFSNIISEDGRKNGYVWASFDGGKRWPVKRCVEKGSFAYSSMTAGRNNTASEGYIYLIYESDDGAKVARFNMAWLLDGKNIKDYLK